MNGYRQKRHERTLVLLADMNCSLQSTYKIMMRSTVTRTTTRSTARVTMIRVRMRMMGLKKKLRIQSTVRTMKEIRRIWNRSIYHSPVSTK